LQRRTPIPDLGVLVDYNRPQEGVPPSYDLLLSVPIPLFDRNQGNITQAEAQLAKAQLTQESLRNQIRSDLWKGLQEWRAASGLLTSYESGTVDAAKESLEITKHAYDLGTGTLLDYLDAEQSYRMIESAYRAALARTAIAAQNVQFITGEVQP
jgi:cobalt-zinc-cadmium efflux system outer membrane protein